jgi:AcrR family transcriptional regulator
MADIAERVGLTAGSLYHHFEGGKPSLLAAVLNEGMDSLLRRIETILGQPVSPAEMLQQMIEAHVSIVTENVAAGAALVFESRAILEIEEAREPFLKRRDTFEHYYRTVIERGIACGQFRPLDVPLFTKALLGAHNWIGVWYHPGGRLSGPQIAEQMADMWLASLRYGAAQPVTG